MSGRWWRAYSRARHDPKLLKLTDKQFRWWFNFICVAADNKGVLPPHADLAVEFRMTGIAVTKLLDELIKAGLLDHDETGIRPHNWNGLQYQSDVSTTRVKRFRQRHGNVSVTPSEAESETEADTEQIIDSVANAPKQKRKSQIPADWQPTDDLLAYAKQQGCTDPSDTFERFRLHHASKGTTHKDWTLAAKYWCRNEKQFRRPEIMARVTAGLPVDSDDSVQWAARLRGYGRGGMWSTAWGPRPESGECWAPESVLNAWREQRAA